MSHKTFKEATDSVMKKHESTFLRLRIKELEEQLIGAEFQVTYLKKRLFALDKAVIEFASRPTKDGAKNLRELSYQMVEDLDEKK